MAKIALGIALVAGAIALTVVTGGGGAWLGFAMLGQTTTLTAGEVAALSMSMGMMGGGMIFSSIAQSLSGGGPSTSQSVRQPTASRQTIYGQSRVTGTTIYFSSIDHTINQVVAWASHLCQSVDYIYLDGRQVFFQYGGSHGIADGYTHYDASGNSYNFKSSSGNTKVACFSTLGDGTWLSSLHNTIGGTGYPLNNGGDPNWTSDCTLNGICATHVATGYDTSMFASIPNIKASIHGKCDIYDPRLGPLNTDGTVNSAYCAWTDNAALIIADFLTNSDYGFGYLWSEIDITQLIAAANICDEQVLLAAYRVGAWTANYHYALGQMIVDSNGRMQTVSGFSTGYVSGSATSGGSHPTWGTSLGSVTYDNQVTWTAGLVGSGISEKRYTINGVVDWASTPGDTLTALLAAMEGRISRWDGLVKIFPAAWTGATLSFDMGDLVDGMTIQKRKARDLANAMRGTYICPSYPYNVVGYDKDHKDNNVFDGQWQPVDIPNYAQDALHWYGTDANLAADGGVKLWQDRRYQYVTSCGQAQRLLKIYLLRNRQQWSGTLKLNLAGIQTCPADNIQFTCSVYSWTNKLFEVQSLRYVPNIEDGKPPTMTIEVDVNETDPSVYTWSSAEELGLQNTPSPALQDSLQVVDPTGLTLEADASVAVVGLDGIVTPRILASWTEPDDPFTTSGGSIAIQYQKNGDTAWTDYGIATGATTSVSITGVVSGQAYNVQIQARHGNGALGNWVACGPITVTSGPSNIVSTVFNNQGSIIPSQLTVVPYTVTNNSVTFSWASQSVLRADGSTLTVPAGSLTYSSLAASTAYYSYWYINATTGVLGQTNSTPPPTLPSSFLFAQCSLDGRVPIGTISFTTLAISNPGTGGGTGGGGDLCPESAESVDVKDKGIISAGKVQTGDYIKGKCFHTGEDVYRKVIQATRVSCCAWRMVDGHRVSPCEPVYYDGQWMPAFRVPTATVDTFKGTKVLISVESDEYDEQNYYLTSGVTLLIHNTRVSPC